MWVLMCSMSEWLVVQYCVICVCQRSFSIFQGHDFYFMKPKIEVNELMMITRTISTWCAQKFIHWLKLTKRNDNYPWNSIMEKSGNTNHEMYSSIVFSLIVGLWSHSFHFGFELPFPFKMYAHKENNIYIKSTLITQKFMRRLFWVCESVMFMTSPQRLSGVQPQFVTF